MSKLDKLTANLPTDDLMEELDQIQVLGGRTDLGAGTNDTYSVAGCSGCTVNTVSGCQGCPPPTTYPGCIVNQNTCPTYTGSSCCGGTDSNCCSGGENPCGGEKPCDGDDKPGDGSNGIIGQFGWM